MIIFFVQIYIFTIFLQIHKGTCELQVKAEGVHDETFHSHHILGCVGIVSYFNKIFQLGRIDFFVFAGNEHRGDSDQL